MPTLLKVAIPVVVVTSAVPTTIPPASTVIFTTVVPQFTGLPFAS